MASYVPVTRGRMGAATASLMSEVQELAIQLLQRKGS